jgi:AcrR family transcriptional regulator
MEYNEKQTQIIDAAEKLFATHGFDGTSVRDIAQEVGINIAMISYYFGSKEKLMEAVFEKRTVEARLRVENLVQNKELSPLQKIYILIDDYVEKIMQQQQFHKIMLREQMIEKDNIIARLIHTLKKRNLDFIRSVVQDGQKGGVFKKNIDIPMMMTTMIGTAHQLVITQNFYREVNGLEALSEQDFLKHLKKKLSHHLKTLFKAILTYEA